MGDADIEKLARATAKATVEEMFLVVGMDVSTPEGVTKAQEVFAHLRRSHAAAEAIRAYGIKALMATIIAAAAAALWSGFIAKLPIK